MDIKIAAKNLDGLIAMSRLNREEHVALQQSLECLQKAAEKKSKKGKKNEPTGKVDKS